MKKLLGLFALVALTGCGQGWLYRGEPCGGCPNALPAAPAAACTNCGTTSGYATYDGVIEGEIVGGPYYNDMTAIPTTPAN